MLRAARRFKVDSLSRKCRSLIRQILSPSNVCSFLEKSIEAREKDLIKDCKKIISTQTLEVISSKEFENISWDSLAVILRLQQLACSELTTFKACCKWALAECERKHWMPTPGNQRRMLGAALYLIHIPLIPLQQFANHVVVMGILTDQETLDLYKYMTCKQKPKKLPFPTKSRK